MPTKSSSVKIEGKRIHYLTEGQGPHLILLHGYTQTSRMWRALIEKLKEKFTVYAPDLLWPEVEDFLNFREIL